MISGAVTIVNVSLSASTEGSYALLAGTNKVLFKLRQTGVALQLAYISGESNTTYITIPAGSSKEITDIKGTGLTLYFFAASAVTVEIEVWQ